MEMKQVKKTKGEAMDTLLPGRIDILRWMELMAATNVRRVPRVRYDQLEVCRPFQYRGVRYIKHSNELAYRLNRKGFRVFDPSFNVRPLKMSLTEGA